MSKIEWTEETWNPTTGCNKVSEGCKNCYAEKQHRRMMAMFPKKYKRPFLDGAFPDAASLEKPFDFKKPTMFFVDSMSDLFHENISIDFIQKVFDIMHRTPHHTYQILTKRPKRMLELVTDCHLVLTKNIWLGVSCENQNAADERIPLLLQIPAAVRFLSCEPLIEKINLIPHFKSNMGWESTDNYGPNIQWVICGGESGHNARPMHPDWARNLRDQCNAAGVPFFFKQWGQYMPEKLGWHGNTPVFPPESYTPFGLDEAIDKNFLMLKVGKKKAGRLLDGREWNEFPKAKEVENGR